MGFISGLLGAAIYNLAAGFTGGIEMELEGGTTAPLPTSSGLSGGSTYGSV